MATLTLSAPPATHRRASAETPNEAPQWLGLLSAAGLSLVLHAVLFALLVWQWQPAPTPPQASAPVLITQLIAPPKPAPAAPAAPVVPAPPPHLELQKEQPKEQAPPPPVEDATLARKRLQEQQRQEHHRQEQQRLREQQQRQQQLQREQAEREHLAALAQAEHWAANNHDYAPLDKPAPDYPERALSRGIEGECTVEYTVTAAGRVENPRIVGECHPLFIRTSMNAAKAFRYQPRRVDGQPQAVANVRNTFHYRIEDQR